MRLPFRRKALTADSAVPDAIRQGWSPWPLLGGGARERIENMYNVAQGASYGWLYARSPAVREIIDGIVRDVGALDLRLYEEVSESERQPRPDHPAALSVRYPNQVTTGDGLVRGLVKDFLIHDNAYALLQPGTDGQVQVIRIPAHMVVVQGSSLWMAENYRVWPQGAWTSAGTWGGGGKYVDFSPDQIFHWHGENPSDPRVGVSHLDTLRGVVAEDAAMQQANVELANAGLQEPAWVYRPIEAPPWSNEARAAFEEDLTNRIRRRTRKPVVLEESMEMRSFGVSPHDAEMMAVRQWVVAQVANEYGVPRGKAGLDPATQEDEDAYLADVLVPLCKSFASMLNLRLLIQVFDMSAGVFEFNLDERVMGNDRLRALVSATGRAVMLTNEGRAKLNLPPVDGGDELVTPGNVIVGEKPSPMVMPPQDPNRPPQDGSYRQEQGPTPIASTETQPKALEAPMGAVDRWFKTASALGMIAQGESDRIPRLHPRHAAEMERQQRNVDAAAMVMQRHFNRLGRALEAKAGGSVDWERWNRELADDIGNYLNRVYQAEGDLYSFRLGGSGFDLGQVDHYVSAWAESAAGAINDTVRQDVSQQGLDAAMARTSQHVASLGESLGVKATTRARLEAARQSPGYENRVMTWISDTGRHREFDGDTVPIGANWPAGFAPGGEAGCQCSLTVS